MTAAARSPAPRGLPLVAGGAAGLFLAVSFGWTLLSLRILLDGGRWEVARLHVGFALALLLPASGLLSPVRRLLGGPMDPPLRWPLSSVAVSILGAPAVVLGRSPGFFLASLSSTLVLVLGLAAAGATFVGSLRGWRAGLRAAWLILSAFVLTAAWQVGVLPLGAVAHFWW